MCAQEGQKEEPKEEVKEKVEEAAAKDPSEEERAKQLLSGERARSEDEDE